MSSSYALGSDDNELQRLKRQHALWQGEMRQSWAEAGFGSGQRLLDVGCGPGFASLELAQLVGPSGQVLAIDNAPAFLEHLQQQRTAQGLNQLDTLRHDLAVPLGQGPVETGRWDGAWCRWVAMFVPQIEPMLDLIAAALRSGGTLVMHEYVQWDTFALYPRGSQLSRFVEQCIQHWRSLGGDPDVARRLPPLLEARGFRLLSSSSLMACSTSPHPKARWLDDFLRHYGPLLISAGEWSSRDQEALVAELDWANAHDSLWVTPALVSLTWERR